MEDGQLERKKEKEKEIDIDRHTDKLTEKNETGRQTMTFEF